MYRLKFDEASKYSIIERAMETGLCIPNSCNDGRCGVCVGKLIHGNLRRNQKEVFLENQPDEHAFLACCCSAETPVTVEFKKLFPNIFPPQIKTIAKIGMVEAYSDKFARFRVRLRPGTKFDFIAGQYVAISSQNIGKRLYSIASFEKNNLQFDLIITKVEHGAMSEFLFSDVHSEKLIMLEGPNGSFHLPDRTFNAIHCFATGSGIAPIISILDKLSLENDPRINKIKIFWGYRYNNDGDIDIEKSYPSVDLKRFCSRERDKRSVGKYVHEIEFDEYYHPENMYLACGNPTMIDNLSTKLSVRDFDRTNFNYDSFFEGIKVT